MTVREVAREAYREALPALSASLVDDALRSLPGFDVRNELRDDSIDERLGEATLTMGDVSLLG